MNAITDSWIQTFTGKRFMVKAPDPKSIVIEDIAIPLSRCCRYAGHCRRFYSVAEHCVLVAERASEKNKLTALMHDASEAYLVDIPRPIKPLLTNYYDLEDGIMRAIADKYGFEWPLPAEVKNLDNSILVDERDQNMAPMDCDAASWGAPFPKLGIELRFWHPGEALSAFLGAFHRYGGRA